jgi:hypothetical protein
VAAVTPGPISVVRILKAISASTARLPIELDPEGILDRVGVLQSEIAM